MDAPAAGGSVEDGRRAKQDLLKPIDDINKKLQDVEYQLITRADALSDDKYFQTAYNLYQNFLWLNGEIGTGAGDVHGLRRLRRRRRRRSAWCSIWRRRWRR